MLMAESLGRGEDILDPVSEMFHGTFIGERKLSKPKNDKILHIFYREEWYDNIFLLNHTKSWKLTHHFLKPKSEAEI